MPAVIIVDGKRYIVDPYTKQPISYTFTPRFRPGPYIDFTTIQPEPRSVEPRETIEPPRDTAIEPKPSEKDVKETEVVKPIITFPEVIEERFSRPTPPKKVEKVEGIRVTHGLLKVVDYDVTPMLNVILHVSGYVLVNTKRVNVSGKITEPYVKKSVRDVSPPKTKYFVFDEFKEIDWWLAEWVKVVEYPQYVIHRDVVKPSSGKLYVAIYALDVDKVRSAFTKKYEELKSYLFNLINDVERKLDKVRQLLCDIGYVCPSREWAVTRAVKKLRELVELDRALSYVLSKLYNEVVKKFREHQKLTRTVVDSVDKLLTKLGEVEKQIDEYVEKVSDALREWIRKALREEFGNEFRNYLYHTINQLKTSCEGATIEYLNKVINEVIPKLKELVKLVVELFGDGELVKLVNDLVKYVEYIRQARLVKPRPIIPPAVPKPPVVHVTLNVDKNVVDKDEPFNLIVEILLGACPTNPITYTVRLWRWEGTYHLDREIHVTFKPCEMKKRFTIKYVFGRYVAGSVLFHVEVDGVKSNVVAVSTTRYGLPTPTRPRVEVWFDGTSSPAKSTVTPPKPSESTPTQTEVPTTPTSVKPSETEAKPRIPTVEEVIAVKQPEIPKVEVPKLIVKPPEVVEKEKLWFYGLIGVVTLLGLLTLIKAKK